MLNVSVQLCFNNNYHSHFITFEWHQITVWNLILPTLKFSLTKKCIHEKLRLNNNKNMFFPTQVSYKYFNPILWYLLLLLFVLYSEMLLERFHHNSQLVFILSSCSSSSESSVDFSVGELGECCTSTVSYWLYFIVSSVLQFYILHRQYTGKPNQAL